MKRMVMSMVVEAAAKKNLRLDCGEKSDPAGVG
jgi:hypothetical protein